MIPAPPKFLFVRFEQGRGKGGVPLTWVPYWEKVSTNGRETTMDDHVAKAVASFRVSCRGAHGQDLMPGEDASEYSLCQENGSRISGPDDFRWEQQHGVHVSAVVLVWRNPADLLLKETQNEAAPA